MNNRQTSNRLERRAERAGKQVGAAPRAYRQRRGNRTPVKVSSGSGINWALIGAVLGIGVVAAVLVYVVLQAGKTPDSQPGWLKAELDSSDKLPGQYVAPNPGPDKVFPSADDRTHFGEGVKWPFCTDAQIASGDIGQCYTSNPPTSGWHSSNPGGFKVYENPVPKENLLHSMEHGGVVVWYNTDDKALIDQLARLVNDELDRRKLVVMTKYTEMEPNTIAVTSWTRLDKFPVSDFNTARVKNFIEAHSKRFNPEGF